VVRHSMHNTPYTGSPLFLPYYQDADNAAPWIHRLTQFVVSLSSARLRSHNGWGDNGDSGDLIYMYRHSSVISDSLAMVLQTLRRYFSEPRLCGLPRGARYNRKHGADRSRRYFEHGQQRPATHGQPLGLPALPCQHGQLQCWSISLVSHLLMRGGLATLLA